MEPEPAVTSLSVKTLYSYDTELSADSVEWCPHEPHQNIFVCANYHLVSLNESKGGQERLGRILLFSVLPITGLQLIQTIDTVAILDQKWCHAKVNDHSLLGVVNAVNTVEIYKLTSNKDNDNRVKLEVLFRYKMADNVADIGETIILSLDWSTGKYKDEVPQIICSDSKGNIHRLKLQDEILELCNTWHAHDYEAWIAAFYYWNTNIVFTGGDDSLFLQFDCRASDSPITENKIHEAGVTSIHSNANVEYLIATGSYDSRLRLWDIRNMNRTQQELEMPATLWRLKWNPHNYQSLLAACMLGGVHVVNTGEHCEIVERYHEHKNLSYGADWSHMNETEIAKIDKGKFLIASCSFYDHLLCVWTSNYDITEK